MRDMDDTRLVEVHSGQHPLGGSLELKAWILAGKAIASPSIPGARARAADGPVLPGKGPFPPVLATSKRLTSIEVGKTLDLPEPLGDWPADLPREPRAVKKLFLHMEIFGSNPGYRKDVLVNGKPIGTLVANQGELDAWEPALLPLPLRLAEKALTTGLEIRIHNAANDYFKIRNPRLALADEMGRLILGNPLSGTWVAKVPWAHAEGVPFTNRRSPAIRLRF
jgi:hypothetical protein